MKVEIFSDVLCPWCAVGRARFATALAGFAHRDEVEVAWRSFELDPGAPAESAPDMITHVRGKYGLTAERAERMLAQVSGAGAGEGLDFRFDRARPSNSFEAHQLLHLAREVGGYPLEDTLKGRLFTAYLTEGELVGDRETLVRLAGEVGLDREVARAALDTGRFASAVREDEAAAGRYGLASVPSFVIDATYLVSGAQAPAMIREALESAWAASHPRTVLTPVGAPGRADDGAGCADGSCAI